MKAGSIFLRINDLNKEPVERFLPQSMRGTKVIQSVAAVDI